MECFSSLLVLFCILPVLSMFTYPISNFLFCSCSTLVLLLLVIVVSSFCGKKLLAMESTSNLVFHHCVVAPSFCGKKSFLQWRVVRDVAFHHCVVASSVRNKLLAMEITLVVILQLWWWSLLCSNTVPAASKTCNSKTAYKLTLKSRSFPLLCVHAPLSLSHTLLSTWSTVHKMQCTFQALLSLYCNQIILLLLLLLLRLPNNLLP